MIEDIASATRPTIAEIHATTSKGAQARFTQRIATISLALTHLCVRRSYRPKDGKVTIAIQGAIDLAQSTGNIFTFKTGKPPVFEKVAKPGGIIVITEAPANQPDKLIFQVAETPKIVGTIDPKTFEHLVKWIDGGGNRGDIELELEDAFVDHVGAAEPNSFLVPFGSPVKVLSIEQIDISSGL